MQYRTEIELLLASFGIAKVAFYEIEGSRPTMTAIRITDQPYSHDLVRMIADDILAPKGVTCVSIASSCRYDTDDEIGAVFVTRNIEPEWARSYRQSREWTAFDDAMDVRYEMEAA